MLVDPVPSMAVQGGRLVVEHVGDVLLQLPVDRRVDRSVHKVLARKRLPFIRVVMFSDLCGQMEKQNLVKLWLEEKTRV